MIVQGFESNLLPQIRHSKNNSTHVRVAINISYLELEANNKNLTYKPVGSKPYETKFEWLTSGISKLKKGEDWRLIGLRDRDKKTTR